MFKTYHLNIPIETNTNKHHFLLTIYQQVQACVPIILQHLKENRVLNFKKIDNSLYNYLRKQFPSLNSKIIQNTIKKVC